MITIFLLIVHCYANEWVTKLKDVAVIKKANKSSQSKIISIAATTFFVNVYALVLSSIAVAKRNDRGVIIEPYVNALPRIVCCIDALGVVYWLFCWIASLWMKLFLQDRRIELILFAASTLGPILSFTIHIPYITIAYLNDGTYATSILVYYFITIFVIFGTLNSTFGTCIGAIINRTNMNGDRGRQNRYWRCITLCIPIFVPHVVIIPILVLAGMIAAMLMIVPIANAFSDAPSRLQAFYQTAAVVVGVYFVYWNFYKKNPSIDSVISEREGCFHNQARLQIQWDTLSEDERVKEFYAKFVDIVMNYVPIAGENHQLVAANQQLQKASQQLQTASEQLQTAGQRLQEKNGTLLQLQQANNQLQNANQQLQIANQHLQVANQVQAANLATNQQQAANQQLAADHQLHAANQQLDAINQQLQAAAEHLRVANQHNAVVHPLQQAQDQAFNQQQQAANLQQQAANRQRHEANLQKLAVLQISMVLQWQVNMQQLQEGKQQLQAVIRMLGPGQQLANNPAANRKLQTVIQMLEAANQQLEDPAVNEHVIEVLQVDNLQQAQLQAPMEQLQQIINICATQQQAAIQQLQEANNQLQNANLQLLEANSMLQEANKQLQEHV